MRSWGARGAPRGAVMLVHGLGEHSGRYDHVGHYLAEKGFSVFAYDHQGHGRSEGRRGWVADFAHFLDDLETFHRIVLDRAGQLPIALLGHCRPFGALTSWDSGTQG